MAENKPAARKPGPKSLSGEHKAALAAGRARSRVVRAYLDATQRAVAVDPEEARARLAAIDEAAAAASPVQRLHLAQERVTLERALAALDDAGTIAALEDAFVAVAQAYSAQKGIGYAAWRAVGVDDRVLRRAGIRRPRPIS